MRKGKVSIGAVFVPAGVCVCGCVDYVKPSRTGSERRNELIKLLSQNPLIIVCSMHCPGPWCRPPHQPPEYPTRTWPETDLLTPSPTPSPPSPLLLS
ncbi:hypothetical protein RRG08_019448 [Elysia crispata]|uniref:Uncharacterized protein n=1 Tax=Elysia crispata TaxID=231223 RepID=A0AAE0YBS9_9GAST|nr:hypothetical protein RRG08_019448 [Elysia crispata]